MKTTFATRKTSRRPTPPGEMLAEDVIPATGLSKTEIASRLGISRQSLYDILNCRQPVTPQMALRIGKLFGNGPRLWLNMQATYDLWLAEQSVDVSGIPTLERA
jgi:addiction module HigA family antidote